MDGSTSSTRYPGCRPRRPDRWGSRGNRHRSPSGPSRRNRIGRYASRRPSALGLAHRPFAPVRRPPPGSPRRPGTSRARRSARRSAPILTNLADRVEQVAGPLSAGTVRRSRITAPFRTRATTGGSPRRSALGPGRLRPLPAATGNGGRDGDGRRGDRMDRHAAAADERLRRDRRRIQPQLRSEGRRRATRPVPPAPAAGRRSSPRAGYVARRARGPPPAAASPRAQQASSCQPARPA